MQGEIEYHTKERVTIKDISAKLGIHLQLCIVHWQERKA